MEKVMEENKDMKEKLKMERELKDKYKKLLEQQKNLKEAISIQPNEDEDALENKYKRQVETLSLKLHLMEANNKKQFKKILSLQEKMKSLQSQEAPGNFLSCPPIPAEESEEHGFAKRSQVVEEVLMKVRENASYLSGRVKQLESDLQRVSEEKNKSNEQLNRTQIKDVIISGLQCSLVTNQLCIKQEKEENKKLQLKLLEEQRTLQEEHRQKVDENKYFHQQLELKQKKEEELCKIINEQDSKNADLQNILAVQSSASEKLKHNIAQQIKMLEETEMERKKLKQRNEELQEEVENLKYCLLLGASGTKEETSRKEENDFYLKQKKDVNTVIRQQMAASDTSLLKHEAGKQCPICERTFPSRSWEIFQEHVDTHFLK